MPTSKQRLDTDTSSTELLAAKIARTGVLLNPAMTQAITSLEQAMTLDNIKASLDLLEQGPKDITSALVNWTYGLRFITTAKTVQVYLRAYTENATRFCQVLFTCLAALAEIEPNLIIYQGITLGWSVAFMLSTFKKMAINTYSANHFIATLRAWLTDRSSQIDWNTDSSGNVSNKGSSLWLLCYSREWEMVKALIAGDQALDWDSAPTQGFNQGKSALWHLCTNRRWDEINTLLTKGIVLDWNLSPASGEEQGVSALWCLCADDRWQEIHVLLTKGIDLEWNSAPTRGEAQGRSPLWWLCFHQCWAQVNILLTKESDLDWNRAPAMGDEEGISALWYLCADNRWNEINVLLAKGIDFDWNSAPIIGEEEGISALWWLCHNQCWDEIKVLLAKDIDLDWNRAPKAGDNEGRSALWQLCNLKQWDLVSACLTAEPTLELVQGNILGLLLESPLFTLWKERIKSLLYTTHVEEITVNLPTVTAQQQAFLQEVVAQHPTFTTIRAGTLILTKPQPDMTADRVKWILAACEELTQAIDEETLYTPSDLPTSFMDWQNNLTTLEGLTDQSGYVERVRHDYIMVLIRFLDACVKPKVIENQLAIKTIEQATAEEASLLSMELKRIAADKESLRLQPTHFCQLVLALIKHVAVTQLSWQAQASLHEMAYHCLLIEGLEASSYQGLIYRACYCYQKAAEQYQGAAQHTMETLLKAYYQRQVNKLLAAKQRIAELCQNQLFEAAGLGLRDNHQELKMTETEQLIHTFHQQLQLTTAQPLLQLSTDSARITVSELFNYLIQTYYQTPTVMHAIHQIHLEKTRTWVESRAGDISDNVSDARPSTQQVGGLQTMNYATLFSTSVSSLSKEEETMPVSRPNAL